MLLIWRVFMNSRRFTNRACNYFNVSVASSDDVKEEAYITTDLQSHAMTSSVVDSLALFFFSLQLF